MLNPITDRVERYMDLLALRQQVTASNIANADTPGYRTRDVEFSIELGSAFQGTDIMEVDNLPVKNDGNNVSLDREARNLAENGLRFLIASQLVQGQIRLTRAALQEGR